MKSLYLMVAFTISATFFFTGCEKERFIDQPGYLVPRTVVDDPTLPSITINGARLHSEAFGPQDSAMLVVIHGGPGGDYRYMLNSRAFAEQGYRVVFYDQRGCGLSERFPKSSFSIEIMMEDLAGVIDHYRTSTDQKVFLFGHSWGAMLATAYVNENPGKIDGLILGEPGGLVWQDVVDYVNRWRKVRLTSETLNDLVFLDEIITARQPQQDILDYKSGLFAIHEYSLVGDEDVVPFWRNGFNCNEALTDLGYELEPDWTTSLYRYTTRVLFMYSQNNTAYGAAWAQRVSSPYPDVQLFEVKDAGHDFTAFDRGWNNAYPVILDYLNSMK